MSFSLEHLYKEKSRGACALMGPYQVFIDHTAPICSLLNIPLLTDNPSVKFTYERFYPGLQFKIKKWTLEYLLEHYSTVFYAFRPTPSFFQLQEAARKKHPGHTIYQKKTKFIYHLHGCSDKGYHSDWIAPKSHFLDVDQILFYGERMLDIFKDNRVLDRVRSYALVGNYRYLYYLKHRDFYQDLISREVFDHFKKEQPTLLYAPSWKDPEGSCSLFEAYEDILKGLPDHFNLVLKLHPYLSIKTPEYDPKPLYDLLAPYINKPNIHVIPMLPMVYPLLDRVVGYIGDYSSIGYDALTFRLPLFFLNHNNRSLKDKGAYLLRCGREIQKREFSSIYSIIEKELSKETSSFQKEQEETYQYAFGKNLSHKELLSKLKSLLQ